MLWEVAKATNYMSDILYFSPTPSFITLSDLVGDLERFGFIGGAAQ